MDATRHVEVEIDGFLAKHATATEGPHPELVAFIRAQRERP